MIDMRMYKAPDYRCLKPKPGLPSSKWPHYDMEQHRAAKTVEELKKVGEIPFDKESSLFSSKIIFDPSFLNAYYKPFLA